MTGRGSIEGLWLAPMVVAALGLSTPPGMAAVAGPLLCLLSPACGDIPGCIPGAYTIEIAPIDHEDGLWFGYAGTSLPAEELPPDDTAARRFRTIGGAQLELLSVFDDGAAIHTRSVEVPGQGPVALTSHGQCETLL